MKISLKTTHLHLLIIITLTSLVYINIFQNQFVWDDEDFIVNWEETKSLKNIPLLLKGAVPSRHEGVYRPLRGLFYALSYKLWGLNRAGYHFQSILVHLICTILVYFVVADITKKNIIAFMSALIFGIHPIHVEAVTFMTASFDTIGIIFFLASFYLYLRAQSTKDNFKANIASITFAILAFFTYELTLTLPLLIVLYDICFRKIERKNITEKLKIHSPYFIILMFYLLIRVFILHTTPRGSYLAGSFYITMLIMTKVFVKYILLAIFPVKLSVDHTISKGISAFRVYISDETLFAQSLFNFDILFSIAVIAALLIVAVKCFKEYPLVSFCMGWFFIGLAPVSHIIPQYMLLAEKYLYIPSFGFCLLFSSIIYSLYHLRHNKQITRYTKIASIALSIFMITTYSALTIARNNDWKDELTLWLRTVETSPESISSHNNLGLIYDDFGKIDLAIKEYKRAVEINPRFFEAHYNLGVAYYDQGKIYLAIEEYKKALAINQNFTPAHYNLGNAYRKNGDINLAIEEYKNAIAINPNHANAHNNLGIAYHSKGKINLAIEEYKKAIKINPELAEAHNNLGIAYAYLGKFSYAILEYEKAIKLDPNYAQAHYNLGLSYQEQGHVDLAIEEYKNAIEIYPNYTKAKEQLEEIYSSNKAK
ncbi:tetratricopeptide repeat protein [Candidatus Woesearchaeota archaeon]|nr:tetratricopeptide repeat protein [Candidatus Woesearchaeota archaeon]